MTRLRFEFHSPLTLLRQWQARSDGARLREVLITGYTLDLVFVERHCVSLARGLGARVTVLSDAHQPVHDAADVRHAGRSYQHGYVGCRGAFHPKLVLLVGDDEVWVAIGSGNPTTSGWGHNDEVWLVLRSRRRSGPVALLELAEWLTALPRAVSMPSWIAETLTELAQMITPELIDVSMPDLQILGNLDRPLLEQLPTGAVRSLRLSAPFFDPASDAVRALVTRMDPGEVVVAIQPTLSRFHGAGLVEATAAVPRVEFRVLDETRTSHGKLVEWADDTTITALVGSANLSRAGLLTSTRRGGNCELAAISPVTQTLLPEGIPLAAQQMHTRSTQPSDPAPHPPAPVTLLGARWQQGTITVELLADTAAAITIETSPTAAPGTWLPAHVVRVDRPGSVMARFQAPEHAGGAVRAALDTATGRYLTSVVFLTDTARCLPRELDSSAPRLDHHYEFEEIFTDPQLAARFSSDLLRLLTTIAEHRSGAAPRSDASAPVTPARDDDDRWDAWLQDVERTLGPSFAGLLFPGSSTAPLPETVQWTVDTRDTGAEISDDENEEDVDPLATDTRLAPALDPSQHALWRSRAAKLRRAVTADPPPPLELRMAVTLLYLDLLAAGVWGPDDDWRADFATLLTALPPHDEDGEDVPGRALSFMASLVAVGLALLFQDASLHSGTADDVILRSTWNEIGHWAAFAEHELVANYLYQPTHHYSRVAGEAGVAGVIDLALESADDPHAATKAALDAEGLSADFLDGAWVADADSSPPRRLAARIATLVGDTCAVLVQGERGNCAVLRHRSTLALGESTPPVWHLFDLSAVSTPTSLLTDPDGLPKRRNTFRRTPAPNRIADLTRAIGVNLDHVTAFLHSP